MTSPRQRKKGLAILRSIQEAAKSDPIIEAVVVTDTEKPVDLQPPPVVESAPASKAKKTKTGLVETKAQDQVLEQNKVEVKTQVKE
jgi:hypothetical protein